MALNTELGWSSGDDIRVLIASGLPVGVYQIQQVRNDMNYLGEIAPDVVSPIIDLLDAYDAAQSKMSSLNATSEGRILTKVDVLEWAVAAPGSTYSPERELERIRGLLCQYFALSPLFTKQATTTLLVRS